MDYEEYCDQEIRNGELTWVVGTPTLQSLWEYGPWDDLSILYAKRNGLYVHPRSLRTPV